MTITPTGTKVLIRPDTEPDLVKSPGGIWISRATAVERDTQYSVNQGAVADKPRTGVVVALGNSPSHTFTVRVNDRVLLAPQCGKWIGQEFIVIEESDLRLIIAKDTIVRAASASYPQEQPETRPW